MEGQTLEIMGNKYLWNFEAAKNSFFNPIMRNEMTEYIDNLRSKLKIDLEFFDQILNEKKSGEKAETALKNSQTAYLEFLQEKRKILDRINHKTEFDEDLIRKYLSLIDLEEYKIRERQLPAGNAE